MSVEPRNLMPGFTVDMLRILSGFVLWTASESTALRLPDLKGELVRGKVASRGIESRR